MTQDNERIPATLIGGPYDGYEGISVHAQDLTIRPSGHHAQGRPTTAVYNKESRGRYVFAGYLVVKDCVLVRG